MIPAFSDLLYFIAIAECQNLSRASERLGVGQPALSQAVKRLENAAGGTLLIRRKTGVELTHAGKILHREAERLTASWRHLMKEVKEVGVLPKGRLQLGVHPSVALYTLKKFLPRLVEGFPLIEIALSHGLSREILEEVVSGSVDLGLVINPRKHPDLVIKKLCEDRVGFWRATDHTKKDVLICDPALGQTLQLLKKSKIAFRREITTSNLEIAADLAAAGVGIGLLPERVAQRYSLKPWMPQFFLRDELALCYRPERQRGLAAKTVIQAICNTQL